MSFKSLNNNDVTVEKFTRMKRNKSKWRTIRISYHEKPVKITTRNTFNVFYGTFASILYFARFMDLFKQYINRQHVNDMIKMKESTAQTNHS